MIQPEITTELKEFPKNRCVCWFDFEKKEYFNAHAGTKNALKVEF